jgi:hypothetical protein
LQFNYCDGRLNVMLVVIEIAVRSYASEFVNLSG